MKYMTSKQVAQEWGISDRRVRALCSAGKIEGAIKEGEAYKIPADAGKPADARFRNSTVMATPKRYLKWNDDIVGFISADNGVFYCA